MSAKFFLDTNIFVYSFDRAEPVKQKKTLALIGEAIEDRNGVISYQIVQEFVNVASRKFAVPLKADDLSLYLREVLLPLCEIHSSSALLREALRTSTETGYSYYDALVLAAAAEAGCRTLYSEDLQHGQTVNSVKILNPFR